MTGILDSRVWSVRHGGLGCGACRLTMKGDHGNLGVL